MYLTLMLSTQLLIMVLLSHLPRETSRLTKFLLDCGEKISLVLSSTDNHRLPLVRGGLEIPCKITANYPQPLKTIWLWTGTKNLLKVFPTNLKIEKFYARFYLPFLGLL